MRTFWLNVGDGSEVRVYYLAHYLAAEAGFFRDQGIAASFLQTATGGHTAMGGQIGPVVEGTVDACVGGPMVTMKLLEQGIKGIVSFCALAQANPWVVAAAHPITTGLDGLAGKTIIDSGNVTTATLCLTQAVDRRPFEQPPRIERGSGSLEDDIRRAEDDAATVIHHSLHALGPYVASGRLSIVVPMARVTPRVPWSAYIARSDRLAEDPDLFAAFRRGIESALRHLHSGPVHAIAQQVAGHYQDYDLAALAEVIALYRDWGVFAPTSRIARADMTAFADIMNKAGWLDGLPCPDKLLAPEIAS